MHCLCLLAMLWLLGQRAGAVAMDNLYLDFVKNFNKFPTRRFVSKCAGLGIQGDRLENSLKIFVSHFLYN